LHPLPETHTVAVGDTIGAIALRYGIPQKVLKQMNGLQTDLIHIGQTLDVEQAEEIKPPIEYIVTIGDTLSSISERFDVSVQKIRDQNGQQLSSDIIHPGERLSLLVILPATE
jgi:LysM repeat protein